MSRTAGKNLFVSSAGTFSMHARMSRRSLRSINGARLDASWDHRSGAVPDARSTMILVSNSGGVATESILMFLCAAWKSARNFLYALSSGLPFSSGLTSKPTTLRVTCPAGPDSSLVDPPQAANTGAAAVAAAVVRPQWRTERRLNGAPAACEAGVRPAGSGWCRVPRSMASFIAHSCQDGAERAGWMPTDARPAEEPSSTVQIVRKQFLILARRTSRVAVSHRENARIHALWSGIMTATRQPAVNA